MALDERERLELRHALVEALGPEQGNRLMDQVPPFDWTDVAMRSDLVALEERLEARFERIDARFDNVDRRLENIDRRFENIDRRFENIDREFSTVHAQFDTVNHQLRTLLARPENNRALYLTLVGVILAVASLTVAAGTLVR